LPEANDPAVVLAIDDEPSVLRLLRLELSSHGYCVITSATGEEGLDLFASSHPDLVVLDLVLPGMSGIEVLRTIKSESDTPVVLLTAKSSEQARLEALSLGADDFIAKPFMPERLSDSVGRLLAEARGEHVNPLITAGEISVDLTRRLVLRGGRPVDLNRSEWELIAQLARSPGEPRLYQELLTRVWGPDYREDVGYLRLWIERLRWKLGDSDEQPAVILPYFDVGFILNATLAPEE
jgi:two-component system, OmpR family, KDP operon response regulator KdpE